MDNNQQPKLGLALSGASARSVFYVGFLEALSENNIKLDYISANSGSCIVAAAYACGTLSQLKNKIFNIDREFLFSIIQRSKDKGGIYSMDLVEPELRKYTRNLRFEEVKPLMGFMCVNIDTGQEVVLCMGDIAKAICASCALPGIFSPIKWGVWNLLDGGLINVIPFRAAREAGCDVVIGLDLTSRDYVFSNLEIGIKKVIDFVYRLLGFGHAKRAVLSVYKFLEKNSYFQYFYDIDKPKHTPGMFAILGRSIDISLEAQKKNSQSNDGPDLIIKPKLPFVPGWKRILYLHFADLTGTKQLYELGRTTAIKYLPQIKKLMEEHKSKQQRPIQTGAKLYEQYS